MTMQVSTTTETLVAIEVPPLGESISVAEVLTLLAAPGDLVRAQQVLAELGSDKANMQIEAPASGRITECFAKIGDKVSPGTVLFKIDSSIEVPAAVTQKPTEPSASDIALPPPAQQSMPSVPKASMPASEAISALSATADVPKGLRPYTANQIALATILAGSPVVLQSKLKLRLVGEHPGQMPHLTHIVGALTKAMFELKQKTTYGWPCGHHHPHGFVPDADIRIGLILPGKGPMRSMCLRDLDSKNAIGHRQMLERAAKTQPTPTDLEPAGVTLVFLPESRMTMQLPVFPMSALTVVVACDPKRSDRRRAHLYVSLTADARGCDLLDPASFLEAFASALLALPIASAVGFLFSEHIFSD